MFQLLAIEPDPRQARILRRTIDQYVDGNLVLVKNKNEAISAIDAQPPDLILLTALISPRDEDDLVQHLRLLPEANHLQTLTLPQLSSPSQAGNGHEPEKRGFFSSLRRKPRVEEQPVGCDPQVFAEEIVGYLERARVIKAERSGWSSIESVDLEESRPRPEFDFERPRIAAHVVMSGNGNESGLSLSPGEETASAAPTSAAVDSTIDDDELDHAVVGGGQEDTISAVLPGVDPAVTEPWEGGSAHASFDTESSTLLDTDLESEADALVARLRAGLDRSASPSPADDGQVPRALRGLERGAGEQGSLPDDPATTSQHETILRPEPIEPEQPSVEAPGAPPLDRSAFDAAEDLAPSAPETPSVAPAASSAPAEPTIHAAWGALEEPPHEEPHDERESTPSLEDGGTDVSRTLEAGTRGDGVWVELEGNDDSVDATYESVIRAREALDDEPIEPATEFEVSAPPPAATGSILGLSAVGGPLLGATGEPAEGAIDPGQPPAIEPATPSDLDSENARPDGRQRRWIGALNQALNRVATVVGGKPRPDAPVDTLETDDQGEAIDTPPREGAEAADRDTAILPDRSETAPEGEARPLDAPDTDVERPVGAPSDVTLLGADEIVIEVAKETAPEAEAASLASDAAASGANSDETLPGEAEPLDAPDLDRVLGADTENTDQTAAVATDRAAAPEASVPPADPTPTEPSVVDAPVVEVASPDAPDTDVARLVGGPLEATVLGADEIVVELGALATDRPAAPEASVPPADPTPPDASAPSVEAASPDAPDTDVERPVGAPSDVTLLGADEIVIEVAEETAPEAEAASLASDAAASNANSDETLPGEAEPLDAPDLDRVLRADTENTDQTAAVATDRAAAPEASVPPADPTPTEPSVVDALAVEAASPDASATDIERSVGGPSEVTVLGADGIVIEVAEETAPDAEATSPASNATASGANSDETLPGEAGPLDAPDLAASPSVGALAAETAPIPDTARALATDRQAAPEAGVQPADPTPTDASVVDAPAVEVASLDETDVERRVGGPSDLTVLSTDEIVAEVAEETTPDAEATSPAPDEAASGANSDETPAGEAVPLDAPDLHLHRDLGAETTHTDDTSGDFTTDHAAAPGASAQPANLTPIDARVVEAPAVEVAPPAAPDADVERPVDGSSEVTVLGTGEGVIEVAESTTPEPEAASLACDPEPPGPDSDETPPSEAVPLDAPDPAFPSVGALGAETAPTQDAASAIATDRSAAPEASVPPADPTPLVARAAEPESSTGAEPGAPAASPPAPPRGRSGSESGQSPSSPSAEQLWLSQAIDSLKLDLKQLRGQQSNPPEPHRTGDEHRARRGPTGRPTTRSTPSGAPIAIWARRQHDPAISTPSAAGRETDLFRQLMQGRGIPLQVASVEYARGCRIQRVRVAPNRAAAEVTADEPLVVLSKKKLASRRPGRSPSGDFSDFVDRP